LSYIYKITPRNLGSICLDRFCPCDFWYLSKLKFHPPFDHSGAAIFSDCQAMEEATVDYYLAKDGCLPKEFAPFCDCKARVEFPSHWSKFGYLHKSGVWLYGVPDAILRRSNDTLSLWDHKTAHPKGDKDPYLPQYQLQVVGYADIADTGLGLGRVSNGGLMYWEVQHEAVLANPGKYIHDGMFWAPFAPKPHEVEIDYSRLDGPLKEAEKIWESSVPPEGRDGCKDCAKLQALFAIQSEVDKESTLRDKMLLTMAAHNPTILKDVVQHLRDRRGSCISALKTLQDEWRIPLFAEGGMAANWEFIEDS
jgi:hypothetical protein